MCQNSRCREILNAIRQELLRFGSYKLVPFVFYINHERVVKLTEYVENYSKDLLLTVVVLVSVESFVQS